MKEERKIPLIKPFINEEIKQAVLDVLDSGYLTEGPVTREFEKVFGEYTGAKHAIAVTSCTTGLEIALRAIGIGPGDEVIVPDYTYPATASVVNIVGAHCVIVDVDPATMLIDYKALEKAITGRTRAVIPVSLFGNPLDYTRLDELKKKHKILVIEDAACAIGAEFNGVKVGTLADITVFSLHPRKFITTGEGGMITTNNSEWAGWMDSYKHFGMNMQNNPRERAQFEMVGTNCKLTNFQSAIGLGQMKMIGQLLETRRALASHYDSLFKKNSGIKLPQVVGKGKHSYQSYTILTPNRDSIINVLREKGIETQIGTYALHKHKAFQNGKQFTIHGSMSGSLSSFNNCLTIPLYNNLHKTEQEYIVKQIEQLV